MEIKLFMCLSELNLQFWIYLFRLLMKMMILLLSTNHPALLFIQEEVITSIPLKIYLNFSIILNIFIFYIDLTNVQVDYSFSLKINRKLHCFMKKVKSRSWKKCITLELEVIFHGKKKHLKPWLNVFLTKMECIG